MKKKKEYTIKKNRPIVKCEKCGNKHVEDTMCLKCIEIEDKKKRYKHEKCDNVTQIELWHIIDDKYVHITQISDQKSTKYYTDGKLEKEVKT